MKATLYKRIILIPSVFLLLMYGCVTVAKFDNAHGNEVLLSNGKIVQVYEDNTEVVSKLNDAINTVDYRLTGMEQSLDVILSSILEQKSTDSSALSSVDSVYETTQESITFLQEMIDKGNISRKKYLNEVVPVFKDIKNSHSYLVGKAEKIGFHELPEENQDLWNNIFFRMSRTDHSVTEGSDGRIKQLGQLQELTINGSNEKCGTTLSTVSWFYEPALFDLSFLIQSPSLIELICTQNHLRNIDGLQHTPYIKQLYLDCNEISSLESIGHLQYLEVLSVNDNDLTSLNGIENLPNLNTIYCTGNKIKDISALIALRKKNPQAVMKLQIDAKYLTQNQLNELQSLFNKQITINHERLLIL